MVLLHIFPTIYSTIEKNSEGRLLLPELYNPFGVATPDKTLQWEENLQHSLGLF
jgi:hypothetical protein